MYTLADPYLGKCQIDNALQQLQYVVTVQKSTLDEWRATRSIDILGFASRDETKTQEAEIEKSDACNDR
jgi:hypothetical protein